MVKTRKRLQACAPPAAAGFTYVLVLFLVALLSAMVAKAGELWHTAQVREREVDLLFVGNQYRKAIEMYYVNTPGPVKRYPRELSDLLQDPRQQAVRRYVRKLYRDPVTRKSEWGIVKATDGGIAGVYSLSNDEPMKKANFVTANQDFRDKTKYSDWKFVYLVAPSPTVPAPQNSGLDQKP
jgi:hypothetical protein